MTEDRDKWSEYVHGVANPRIKDGKEQTDCLPRLTSFDGGLYAPCLRVIVGLVHLSYTRSDATQMPHYTR